jgi:hypothetical protein
VTEPAIDPSTPAAPIRVEFTYDLADYVESQTHWNQAGNPTGRRAFLGVFGRGLFGWVLFIGLAIMLFMLLNSRPLARGTPGPVPRPVANSYVRNLLLPVVPWVVIFGFAWFFVYRQIRRSGMYADPKTRPQSSLYEPGTPAPPPRAPTDPEVRSPAIWGLILVPFVAIVYVVIYRLTRHGPVDMSSLLLPVLPWLAIFTVLWFFLARRGVVGWKGAWDAVPQLHRPKVIEADEQRFSLTDAVDRMEHRWEAFTHVQETPHLFLLFTSARTFHFVPKRAFISAAELEAFRDLLRRNVAHRPEPGFPVLPARPAV